MEILYFSEQDDLFEQNGGATIERRNLDALRTLFDVTQINFKNKKRSFLQKIHSIFFSPIPLLYTKRDCQNISKQIKNSNCDIVFIESTRVGYFAKVAKKTGKTVITFAHNCESVFVRMRHNYLLTYLTRKQEKLSLKYSDKIIMLNERDLNDFKRLYKMSHSPSIKLIPITLEDELTVPILKELKAHKKGRRGIFFGSNFAANYNGIKWFVDNVAPNINADIYIYGKGFDRCFELQRSNVFVIGKTDNIPKMMIDADFAVLPIFEGSGMKVKTCHMLMYGKKCFLSQESLEGYDLQQNSYVLPEFGKHPHFVVLKLSLE